MNKKNPSHCILKMVIDLKRAELSYCRIQFSICQHVKKNNCHGCALVNAWLSVVIRFWSI